MNSGKADFSTIPTSTIEAFFSISFLPAKKSTVPMRRGVTSSGETITPRITLLSRSVSRISFRNTVEVSEVLDTICLHSVYDFQKGLLDRVLTRPLSQILNASLGGNDPFVDDRDVVAETFHFAHNVSGEHNG